jgi:hypothetical protein
MLQRNLETSGSSLVRTLSISGGSMKSLALKAILSEIISFASSYSPQDSLSKIYATSNWGCAQ